MCVSLSLRLRSIKSFKTLSECESRIVGRSPNFANNKFPHFLELERRHGVCLGQTYQTTHKCQNFTNMIERRPRNTKRQVNASITVCRDCACVCLLHKETIILTRHSFIVLVFKSVCGSYILQPPPPPQQKKLLINFQSSFPRIAVGKKC